MEVHHHGHHAHEKKTWKNYVWEFLMLFLAVFCGYLAEYQLEQNIERHREKEFILSMLEDAATDTANIHAAIRENERRILFTDSLADACFNYRGTQKENTHIYTAQRNCVHRPDLVYPTDRTLFQLKNAGGMRLIQNKKAAEVIVLYDNSGKNLVNQQTYYEKYLGEITTSSSRLINFSVAWNNRVPIEHRYDSARLFKPDEASLFDLGNKAVLFRGILLQYVIRLKEMEANAIRLMDILNKEYALD
jgi:hypothetical protein